MQKIVAILIRGSGDGTAVMEIIDNHATALYNFQNGSADDLIGSQHINHASSATHTDDGIVLSSTEGLEYPLAKDLSGNTNILVDIIMGYGK